VVSNKKVFSNSGGLGPINVGLDEWVKAKEKQERIKDYKQRIAQINTTTERAASLMPAQTIYLNF
jgi:hypothetical protein